MTTSKATVNDARYKVKVKVIKVNLHLKKITRGVTVTIGKKQS